jgi:hypothetical protein
MVGVSDRIDGWWNQSVSIEGFEAKNERLGLEQSNSKGNSKINGNPFLIGEKRGAKTSSPALREWCCQQKP